MWKLQKQIKGMNFYATRSKALRQSLVLIGYITKKYTRNHDDTDLKFIH